MANPLGNQAAQYADAAVPTVGSINQQYQTGANDVHGFTTALIRLLQQGQGADPYASAVNSQSASNDAEMQRLQNLGSPNMPDSAMAGNPYGAGSAAAVGGMGNSALGALNQMRAAGISYQRQLPSIAAARGELANSTLLTNKQTALTQRSQQYQSAYMQALQQLRDYNLQKTQITNQDAQFHANLAEQNKEFAANQAYQYANLNERANEFKSSQGQQWREALLSAAQNAGSQNPTGPLAGFTPLQIHGMLTDASTGAFTATQQGLGPKAFLSRAINVNNIPAPLALLAVKRVYGSLANVNRAQHPKQWAAFQQYKAWVNSRAFAQSVALDKKSGARNPLHP